MDAAYQKGENSLLEIQRLSTPSPLPWQKKLGIITGVALFVIPGLIVLGYGLTDGNMYMIGGGAGGIAVGLIVGLTSAYILKRKQASAYNGSEEYDGEMSSADYIETLKAPFTGHINYDALEKVLRNFEWTRIPMPDGTWRIAMKREDAIKLEQPLPYKECAAQRSEDGSYRATYLEPGRVCRIGKDNKFVLIYSERDNVEFVCEGCLVSSDFYTSKEVVRLEANAQMEGYIVVPHVLNLFIEGGDSRMRLEIAR